MMRKSCALERQQASEQETPQTEVKGAAAQRSLYLGHWEWNLKTNHYGWCAEMHRIFRLTPTQHPLRTNTFLNRVHPEDRERVAKAIGNALVGAQPFNLEHRILWPDGTVRVVHGRAEVTFDEAGRPQRIMGTIQDITDRRQTN
jgi:PAS domain-containing protein